MKVVRSTYIPVLACGSRERSWLVLTLIQSNERWLTRQSLNNGDKKNSSDSFVDCFELHLELENMNASAVVLIAFGLFAELASIADYPQIIDQYTTKNIFFACRNDGKPTSKWPRRAMMYFVTKIIRIIGSLALYIINLNNIVSAERSSSIHDPRTQRTIAGEFLLWIASRTGKHECNCSHTYSLLVIRWVRKHCQLSSSKIDQYTTKNILCMP